MGGSLYIYQAPFKSHNIISSLLDNLCGGCCEQLENNCMFTKGSDRGLVILRATPEGSTCAVVMLLGVCF